MACHYLVSRSSYLLPLNLLTTLQVRVSRTRFKNSVNFKSRNITEAMHCMLISPQASVDLDECIARLYRKELLADSVIEAICAKAKELLMKESNVVHIQAPVTVVGDIHGQFFDMIEIFKIGGYCPDTNYLFLGRSRDQRERSVLCAYIRHGEGLS